MKGKTEEDKLRTGAANELGFLHVLIYSACSLLQRSSKTCQSCQLARPTQLSDKGTTLWLVKKKQSRNEIVGHTAKLENSSTFELKGICHSFSFVGVAQDFFFVNILS